MKKKLQAKKLDNEFADLRKANPDNPTERCSSCQYFVKPNVCKIVVGPVGPDLLCDWIQSRIPNEKPQYKVDDKDWIAFGVGMIDKQPYQHMVRAVAMTPEGPLVMIEDTMKPPHRFSLTKEFHIGHTSFEHHWTQKEADDLIKIGKSKLKPE